MFRGLGSTILFIALITMAMLWPWAGLDAICAEQEQSAIKKPQWLLIVMTPGGEFKGYRKLKGIINSIRPDFECVAIPYRSMTIDLVTELDPEFIILGPQGIPWCKYTGRIGVHLQSFLWMLPYMAKELKIPILGICGGHQTLAMSFGGKVGPIRAESGDCLPYTSERQLGAVNLQRLEKDMLFAGIGPVIRIRQSHYDEVKELPPDFVLLAWEQTSPNQIMRHVEWPVYGIQGHPELPDRRLNHGAALIRNFLEISSNHNILHRKKNQPQATEYYPIPGPMAPSNLW